MYQIISAIGTMNGLQRQWITLSEDDLSLSLKDLFIAFRRIQFKLTPSIGANPVYLELETLRTAAATNESTLADYLTSLGNASLPTTNTELVINKRTAMYQDIFRLNYKLTPVDSANSSNANIAIVDKDHIRLTRASPSTDYQNLFDHSLVSVNGFYHLTDTDGVNGMMVMDAMKSQRVCLKNQMGLLSFDQIATVTCVPIKASMVLQDAPKQALITLTQDLTNKTVMLVLGGYLHPVDPIVYSRVGNSSYRLNLEVANLLDRYYESKKYIDLSSLPVEHPINNEQQVSVEDFYTEENLLAYLTLSQSFFVILNTPEIYAIRQYVRKTGTPGCYLSYFPPQGPLVTSLGRQPEYWSVYQEGQFSLYVDNSIEDNYLFNTTRKAWLTNVDNSRVAHYTGDISRAYLLEIGKDI